MIPVLPEGAGVPPGLLERATALAGFTPSAVVVEGQGGAWRAEAERFDPVTRARAVLLAATPGALAAAVELGIGGAAWQPPATASMAAAVAAAARARVAAAPWEPGRVAALVGEGAVVLRVPVWSLWRREAGAAVVLGALERVAREARGALVPPAGVAVPAGAVGAARAAWRATVRGGCLADVELAGGGSAGRIAPRFVRELPGGAVVGCWGVAEVPEVRGSLWRGAARRERAGAWVWHLEDVPTGPVTVRWDPAAGPGGTGIRRLPGAWAVTGPASPGRLLLERRVREIAEASGLPWVGGVDDAALRLLLGLGCRCWVDGPAVPGPEVVNRG